MPGLGWPLSLATPCCGGRHLALSSGRGLQFSLRAVITGQQVIQLQALQVPNGDGPVIKRLRDGMSLMTIASTLLLTPAEAAR